MKTVPAPVENSRLASVRCPASHWLADIFTTGTVPDLVRQERLSPAFIESTGKPGEDTRWPDAAELPFEWPPVTRVPLDDAFVPVVASCRCHGKLWLIGHDAGELRQAAGTVRVGRAVTLSNGLRVVRPAKGV